MKIIIDSYIPYIKGVLDAVAEVSYMSYDKMTNETVRDADALIVRTRTRCDAQLLNGSKVKFIASATIGYDHIDAEYCRRNGIEWTNAPGCNAVSVAQYIASALSFLADKHGFDLHTKTLGVVGVGAVGSRIAELGRSFGMNVLLNDPPRARREGEDGFVTLNEICEQSDIISFHTLLNMTGKDATYYLADRKFFDRLSKKPVIINAARGEIVETKALLRAISEEQVSDIVLDCWENEPDINRELLYKTALATPHIAGYSADGKANAATYSVNAVSRFFSLGLDHWQAGGLPEPYPVDFSQVDDIEDFFLDTYDIEADSLRLKHSPETFEQQRSNYPFRREPRAYLNLMNEKIRAFFEKDFGVFL